MTSSEIKSDEIMKKVESARQLTKDKPAKVVAPKVDKFAGFSKIAQLKADFVKAGPVTSVSKKIYTVLDRDGNVHKEVFLQRYDRDYNDHHLKAKKGDIVYVDQAGTSIKNVTHFV